MHPNHDLLDRLYTALNKRDHDAMAACYTPDAHFRDIAFDWDKRDGIHTMWRMICSREIHATFAIIDADETHGFAGAVFSYKFGASEDPSRPGRPVCNPTISTFTFHKGRIVRQEDCCDAKAWARMAIGNGPKGFLAGRIRLLRSATAKAKVAAFLRREARPD